jgi:hypothetical protein
LGFYRLNVVVKARNHERWLAVGGDDEGIVVCAEPVINGFEGSRLALLQLEAARHAKDFRCQVALDPTGPA